MDFQSHFIKFQAGLREQQKTVRQGAYRSNNLVGIKEAFANLSQSTEEYRASVTNLTDTNISLIDQVAKYTNNLLSKESDMTELHKTASNLQG